VFGHYPRGWSCLCGRLGGGSCASGGGGGGSASSDMAAAASMEAIAGFGAACWRGGGGGGLGGEVRAEGRGSELRWGGVGEGEVREAVGVGGAAAVTVHWRGVGGNVRVLGRRQPPLPLARRRGPASNGFELLGGCHVDPSCQMARAYEMNANVMTSLGAGGFGSA
jgi:hypothetical protein